MRPCGDRTGNGRGLIPRLAATGLICAGALAAPALGQTGADTAEGEAEAVTTEVALDEVDAYRLALLEIRGHLEVARALVQLRAAGAGHHLSDALEPIYRRAEDALEERGAPLTRDTLAELANAADIDPERALVAIESAVNAVNGSFAQTGPVDLESVLGLVEALLRRAVGHYEAAVEDNEVTDLRRYQAGRGLVIQAEALVRHSSPLAGRDGQEALVQVVTLIRQAWPSVIPPPIVFDPAGVAGRLDEAVAAMDALR